MRIDHDLPVPDDARCGMILGDWVTKCRRPAVVAVWTHDGARKPLWVCEPHRADHQADLKRSDEIAAVAFGAASPEVTVRVREYLGGEG